MSFNTPPWKATIQERKAAKKEKIQKEHDAKIQLIKDKYGSEKVPQWKLALLEKKKMEEEERQRSVHNMKISQFAKSRRGWMLDCKFAKEDVRKIIDEKEVAVRSKLPFKEARPNVNIKAVNTARNRMQMAQAAGVSQSNNSFILTSNNSGWEKSISGPTPGNIIDILGKLDIINNETKSPTVAHVVEARRKQGLPPHDKPIAINNQQLFDDEGELRMVNHVAVSADVERESPSLLDAETALTNKKKSETDPEETASRIANKAIGTQEVTKEMRDMYVNIAKSIVDLSPEEVQERKEELLKKKAEIISRIS